MRHWLVRATSGQVIARAAARSPLVYLSMLLASALSSPTFNEARAETAQRSAPGTHTLIWTDVHSRTRCLRLAAKVAGLCAEHAFSRRSYIQLILADVNGDGQRDILARHLAPGRCGGGAHGCQTEIYLGNGRAFSRIPLYIVTVGNVALCRSGQSPGVRFGMDGQPGHCFPVQQ